MSETVRRILCLGDSNTFGYAPGTAFGSRYPLDVRWTGRLRAAGWEVINRGMNGSTVPAVSEAPAFDALIRSVQPLDAVTVMFGTNDVLQGGSAEAAGERTARFRRAVGDSIGDAACILLSPPPVTFGDWVSSAAVIRESERLAACCQAVAAELGIRFADAGRWGVGLTFDGVHFTPEGHAAFFEGLRQIL